MLKTLRTYPAPGAHGLGTDMPPLMSGWLGRIGDAAATMRGWLDRSRTRRALAHLDQHLLDDIGRTRLEAQRESAKPFWR